MAQPNTVRASSRCSIEHQRSALSPYAPCIDAHRTRVRGRGFREVIQFKAGGRPLGEGCGNRGGLRDQQGKNNKGEATMVWHTDPADAPRSRSSRWTNDLVTTPAVPQRPSEAARSSLAGLVRGAYSRPCVVAWRVRALINVARDRHIEGLAQWALTNYNRTEQRLGADMEVRHGDRPEPEVSGDGGPGQISAAVSASARSTGPRVADLLRRDRVDHRLRAARIRASPPAVVGKSAQRQRPQSGSGLECRRMGNG